jgi:hypothetical protein
MTRTQARQLGQQAFENGHGNLPFANRQIVAEMENTKVGEKTHILEAFSAGWHAANLNALALNA